MLATRPPLPIVDCNTWVGFYPRQAIDISPQALLALMNRYGVARALFVHTTAVFYDAQMGNDLAARVAQEGKGLLLPVATLNPLNPYGMTEEVERRLRQGFRLFRFFPYTQGWDPTIAPFRDLAHFLADRKVPFLMECPVIGWATRIGEAFQDLPVPVILTDVGEENLGEVLWVLKSLPHFHMETRRLTRPDGYEAAASEIGTDKMIFGSGAPLFYFASSLLPLMHSGLSEEEKRKILMENLRRIVQA